MKVAISIAIMFFLANTPLNADSSNRPLGEDSSSPFGGKTVELAISEGLLHSQKFLKHYFGEKDLVHYPALAKLLEIGIFFGKQSKFSFGFSFPTKPERVIDYNDEVVDSFQFGKALLAGYDYYLVNLAYLDAQFMFTTGLGFFTPLSQRFSRFFAPIARVNCQIVIEQKTGFTGTVGYGGTIADGTVLLSFGVFYRI